LSLGLVGALSIVRFRTAIKEPEELLYLFLAIAVGLGLGADQRLPTLLAVLIILGYLLARAFVSPRPSRNNLYLNIAAVPSKADNVSQVFTRINDLLVQYTQEADLRRLDRVAGTFQATYLIRCPDARRLSALMDKMNAYLPDCEFSFVEQENALAG